MFPPENIEQLLLLIDQELLIIRNIPPTLGCDTIARYLGSFGSIINFEMIPSIQDPGRQEALLLFQDPEVAIQVLNRGVNGIGGFYIEKCNVHDHSYVVSKTVNHNRYHKRETSKNALLSPIYSESGAFDEQIPKDTSTFETNRDFGLSVQKDMASQLIHGYAQLLATGYLTIERWGYKWGVWGFIQDWNIKERFLAVADYFHVQERFTNAHKTAHILKLHVASQAVGRPLVNQYETMKQAIFDMVQNTKQIIVFDM